MVEQSIIFRSPITTKDLSLVIFKGAIYILLRMGPGIRPTINSLKSQTRTNGGDIRGFKDEQRSFT